MSSAERKVALVFGASGISGWAVTNNLLSYPTSSTFSRVIGLTNRPMDLTTSLLPTEDARLEVYSGINLRGELSAVTEYMRSNIPNVEEVTHVYYLAYSNATAYSENVLAIRDINVPMTSNAVRAVDEVCKSLEFLVLQTGTNAYGVAVFGYQDKIDLEPPLKESQSRIPSPYGDEIFYYPQVNVIKEINKGKSWNWCEVRPDVIIGFVPGSTGMTLLEPQALFLSLWRYVNGPGAEVPFIGTGPNYRHTNTDSSHDLIARSEIYLSVMKPEEANGEAFNIADNALPTLWETRWPILAAYFGLKGTPPKEPAESVFPADKWWADHQGEYKRMCAEYDLRQRTITPESWTFALHAGHSLLVRDRSLSLGKIRSVGFVEERSVGEGHFLGYDRMAAAKIIPPREVLQQGA